MNPDKHWQKEVDKSMDLLDNIGRVAPSIGFDAAALNKIRKESRRHTTWSIPAIAAGLLLLIGLNMFSFFSKNNNRKGEIENPVTSFYQLQDGGDVYDNILKR